MVNMINSMEGLYSAGARNFLFLYLPPIQRAPRGALSFYSSNSSIDSNLEKNDWDLMKAVRQWNIDIFYYTAVFYSKYPGTSIFVYDTWYVPSQVSLALSIAD